MVLPSRTGVSHFWSQMTWFLINQVTKQTLNLNSDWGDSAPGAGAEQELTSPGCTFPSLWCMVLNTGFLLHCKTIIHLLSPPPPWSVWVFWGRTVLFCCSEWNLEQWSSELSWGPTIGINTKWLERRNKQQWQQGLNNLHLFKQNGDGGMQARWYSCLFTFLWKRVCLFPLNLSDLHRKI